MNTKYALIAGATALALASLLVACGGGGGATAGGGGNPLPPVSTPTPVATSSASSTTSAQGILVDDPSGTPLAGVKVQVDPWGPYPTPGPTPTPIATTTTDANGHFSITQAPGQYLLVIGDDDPTHPSGRPTIHDHLTLIAGQTTLHGPVLPPLPLYTPPAVETNGDYRLDTINATTEVPCIVAFDTQRTQLGLSSPVVDEWLTENVRGVVSGAQNPAYTAGLTVPANPFGYLTTGNEAFTGGSACSQEVSLAFLNTNANQWTHSTMLWFGGSYNAFNPAVPQISAQGQLEFPLDPRIFTDPNVPTWY